ncbi:hypothetical protein JVT61DRAFT_10540 [Boletus reticuloceps]|uniref:Uncharacterized protein n=1 Tax=Boletus reticuloceps TaxID=495285 RepID=A0A8I3AF03_9AGAM|nr:hypothetical protein JVT61DRAFT_10540 [Boletus reticuloceps]
MNTLRPRAIAYTAVQLRFALSSLTCWRIMDGDFNAQQLYQHIIDYFEAPPGAAAKVRVRGLLLWWDRKVFGPYRDISHAPEVVSSLSVARLTTQHALVEAPPAPPVVT